MRKTQDSTKQSKDDITDLITLSSEKDTPSSNLHFNPAVRFVVAPKETINDLAEYCTGHKDGDTPSSFLMDKMFNVGRFYVTTTCYQNKKEFQQIKHQISMDTRTNYFSCRTK